MSTTHYSESRLRISESREVSALLMLPPDPVCLLVLAHGAGAGMRHAGMEALSTELARNAIATFRFQFPYMEAGGRRPDTPAVAVETIRAAVAAAGEAVPGLPLFAGGRSFGGRMTSTAASESPLVGVRGLTFFAFPLHPSGKPGTARADHLRSVHVPMLFLQGTRDTLTEVELLRPLVESLDAPVTVHVLDGADHSFHVLKRSGRTDEEVLTNIGITVRAWTDRVAAGD